MPNKYLKAKRSLLIFFPIFLLLMGCEFKDIDKDVFVAMIAIDKSDEEDKPYKVTLKLYEPTGSFKQATEPEYSYLTQTGETISEAIRILESYSDKKLEFGHSKLIVIGEDLVLEDGKNGEILDFLIRRPDIQMISWISVGRPTAEEIIKTVPQGETAAYPELFNYFDHNGTESQYIVTTYLYILRRNMKEEGIDTVVPIIEISQENSHFIINKSYLLANRKKPHELNALNTSLFNMLTNNTNYLDLVINEDGEHFIAKIDTFKSKYNVNVQNNENIKIDIEISLYGYISESIKPLKNKELAHYNELLKRESEKKITEFFNDMIKTGYDPLGFGVNYKSKTLHNKRMSDTEWKEAYKNAEVNVTIKPGLKSTGSIQ